MISGEKVRAMESTRKKVEHREGKVQYRKSIIAQERRGENRHYVNEIVSVCEIN